MIQKIRELMQLKQNVDGLNSQLVRHSETVRELSVRIGDFKQALERMNSDSQKLSLNMSKETAALQSFQAQLQEELYGFKLTQKEIRDRFNKEMDTELGWLKKAMEKDIAEFNDLKKKLDIKLQTVDKLDAEVQRLTAISKSIKAQDFEFVRFQKELARQNQEKSHLLRKIDSLEHLVAKLRRKS